MFSQLKMQQKNSLQLKKNVQWQAQEKNGFFRRRVRLELAVRVAQFRLKRFAYLMNAGMHKR